MISVDNREIEAREKFLRSHPLWFQIIRKPLFLCVSFLLLVLYAVMLPEREAVSTAALSALLGGFVFLILLWSANFLSDGSKPEALKMAVSLLLIGVLGWLFYAYSGAQWDKLVDFFFNWKKLSGNWRLLFKGMGVTLLLALISAVGTVFFGLLVAILRQFKSKTMNLFLKIYVDVFRSVPMIVVMVIFFFALPYIGISLGSIVSTVVALSLGYGAYASESFRAGIESVSSGQVEAARSLGLSRWQTIRMIIMPQAIPVVIPPLTGNLVAMLKETAVASIVAAPELLKRARELYTSKTNPTPLIAAALIYLLVLVPLVRVVNMLEKRVKNK
ncbi:MAG: amino acid ABC transporter permease [Spirochaetales bacterium]|nr:amino acid ABC transporter permease [Spirochaetales bacterium]